jgi:biopolymer transport protein ExbB
MRSLLISLLLLTSLSFAQQTNVEQRKIAELKEKLEKFRDERDAIVAKRWKEKRTSNEFREDFNQEMDGIKAKIERAAYEKNQWLDQFRVLKSESQGLREKREKSRNQYLFLSDHSEKINELNLWLDGAGPIDETTYIGWVNSLKQTSEINRDKPLLVVDSLLRVGFKILNEQSKVEVERREILNSKMSAEMGYRLRVGNIFAARLNEKGDDGALMLAGTSKSRKVFRWTNLTDPKILANVKGFFHSDKEARWIPTDVLLSPTVKVNSSAEEEQTIGSWFSTTMKNGGVLAWPIVILFGLAMAFAIERLIAWTRYSRVSHKKLRELSTYLSEDKIEEANNLKESFSGYYGQIVSVVIENHRKSREESESHIEEVFLKAVPQLEKRLNTISVLGGAAPLLGLLGTVFGMIQLFDVITIYGTSDPKLLAGGISIALVTTQMGLIVAVPVTLVHNFVRNRIKNLVSDLDAWSLHLLNASQGKK